MIGNKDTGTITNATKNSSQNNSETVKNEHDKVIT